MSKIEIMIHAGIEIEELVRTYPFSVKYLMEHGVKCIACGEPVWGSLEEAAKEKGFDEKSINKFVMEMNDIAKEQQVSGHNETVIEVKPIDN